MPLLSIAIPAYNRADALEMGLLKFVSQILGKYDSDIEIIIVDDKSPNDSLKGVRDLAASYPFVHFRTSAVNIGLERNLLACAEGATGEYLWIFGDDDFLETDHALDRIIPLLREGRQDMLVLNRTRRSADLGTLISPNWMKLDPAVDLAFPTLREFCLKHGFISVIGFISVNIFRREPFMQVDPKPYFGTMYPQLGAMLEAFHDRPTLLVGEPLVCHRTQTAEEKRQALGDKATEADFMADAERRNALYFSHPYVRMLDHLLEAGAFRPSDIPLIPETTVIRGRLVDFLINCIARSHAYSDRFSDADWRRSERLFARLPLDAQTRSNAEAAIAGTLGLASRKTTAAPAARALTVSVITPSFNQAEFLGECLVSVLRQTVKPLEHFVFDPGSTDGSREIARAFQHVSLIAEPDKGQSDAVNRGFRRAQGDILAWINSDDIYGGPGVFKRVIERFSAADAPDIVYGRGVYIDETGAFLRDVYVNKRPETLGTTFQHEDGILQPALFMRRSVVERVGPLTETNHFSMDYEYWIRCVKAGIKFAYVDDLFAVARYHKTNKTYGQRGKSYAEVCSMMIEQFGYANHIWLKRYAEFLAEGYDGVLATVQKNGVSDQGKLDEIYRGLLSDYNGTHDIFAGLEQRAAEPGYGDTLREMRSLGLGPATPAKEVPLDRRQEPGSVLYTVGPRRWAFDAQWKNAQIDRSHAFLKERIARRNSDTCIIVGNGPSLNKTDLSLLQGHDVIISNNAFLSASLRAAATYYTVVNFLVAEQSAPRINRLDGVAKVLPYWLAYTLNPGPDTYFVDAVGHAEFSTDMFKNMSWRHTVTFFNLHLAYGLGFRNVVMVGFDHSYKQAAGIKEQEIILSQEDDENHFDPGYFKGQKWQAADVDMMEAMYGLAKTAFEADGRRIVNATVGGKLELFERMPLEQALAE
jgi:glycosyltransferase involved in cell wall biosynthesis